jgi:hypothetical protein
LPFSNQRRGFDKFIISFFFRRRIVEAEERRSTEEELKRKGLMEEAKLAAASSGLEEELKLERDWRKSLEQTMENEKNKVADVNAEIEQLKEVQLSQNIFYA